MRERGLKHLYLKENRGKGNVAPHAGAWIETRCLVSTLHKSIVAPHAGAWIETLSGQRKMCALLVAPHAGAWIETF